LSVKKAIWPEFGNVARKPVRLGRWTCAEAQSAIRDAERNLPTVSSKELLVVAFAIASFNCAADEKLATRF
jgi:hypothetical protein